MGRNESKSKPENTENTEVQETEAPETEEERTARLAAEEQARQDARLPIPQCAVEGARFPAVHPDGARRFHELALNKPAKGGMSWGKGDAYKGNRPVWQWVTRGDAGQRVVLLLDPGTEVRSVQGLGGMVRIDGPCYVVRTIVDRDSQVERIRDNLEPMAQETEEEKAARETEEKKGAAVSSMAALLASGMSLEDLQALVNKAQDVAAK